MRKMSQIKNVAQFELIHTLELETVCLAGLDSSSAFYQNNKCRDFTIV